ncbi:MAG: hypothetical protein RRB13_13135 [bacterium]|nr:hypothetical protein [bacterium]
MERVKTEQQMAKMFQTLRCWAYKYAGAAFYVIMFVGCAQVSDIYMNYDMKKPKSEICTLFTKGQKTVRTDVNQFFGVDLIAVDGQLMRNSKLIRKGETSPRYISEQDPYILYGGKQYEFSIVEARLTPGIHDLEVQYLTNGLLPGQFLYAKVKFINWECKAGERYYIYSSNDEVFNHWGEHRYWIEDENQVLWEGWKYRSINEFTFDLSGP